jgi:hypothetical protein
MRHTAATGAVRQLGTGKKTISDHSVELFTAVGKGVVGRKLGVLLSRHVGIEMPVSLVPNTQ